MLKENQLQKLIDKGLTYVLVSKDEDGYSLNILTIDGWRVETEVTFDGMSARLNEYAYRPDAIVEYADNVELD